MHCDKSVQLLLVVPYEVENGRSSVITKTEKITKNEM